MTPRSVSVIIPVKNQELLLRRTISELGAHDLDDVEIIVVDNGSTDRTREVAADCGAIVHCAPDANVSELRNRGAEAATAPTLAFLDSDCVPRRGWLRACRSALSAGASIVGHPYDLSSDPSPFEREWCSLSADASDGTWLPAGNMIIDRSAFEAVGGFDPSLHSGEDQDICRRIREIGGTVVVDSSFRVRHEGNPQRLRDMFRSEVWHTSSLIAQARATGPSKLLVASSVSAIGHLAAVVGVARRSTALGGFGAGAVAAVLGMTMLRRRHNIRDLRHAVRGVWYFEVYYLAKIVGLVREVLDRRTYFNPTMTPTAPRAETVRSAA